MRFISTRGDDPGLGFDDLLFGGVAPDGGLLVPDRWPKVESASTYEGAVVAAFRPFARGSEVADQLDEVVADAFTSFRHPEILPLRQLADGRYLLELFWGPTLAFKDHALQVMGQLLARVLERRGSRKTALVATSGDTGSAAIAAGAGQPNLDVVVLFPAGRVSGFQRRQMTTVADANVAAVAVEGTFDDCQDLVKRAFSNPDFSGRLLAMNSINLVRIVAQSAYFRHIADGHPGVDFVVPSGNFGNVFAAWVAQQMGASIDNLVLASNSNHGLSDFVNQGNIQLEPVVPTLASAMDIQIPSNLERYLFELSGRDPSRVVAWQEELRTDQKLQLEPIDRSRVERDFTAGWVDDRSIRSTMAGVYQSDGLLIDPHTAVAWKVGEGHRRPGQNQVVLAPADPIKFGAAVTRGNRSRARLTGRSGPRTYRPRTHADHCQRFQSTGQGAGELDRLI